MHGAEQASPWVTRWAHLIAPGAAILDLACGSGRHVRWLHARGHAVTGVDRDAAAVEPLRALAEIVVADIEQGEWPLPGRRFGAVLVTNYLWRPLLARLIDSLGPGGVLLYETFTQDQASIGRPSNPDFLLRHGELLQAAAGLRVVAYEDGFIAMPDRFVARLVAVREQACDAQRDQAPVRYPLISPAESAG
jgi:SAM-dependent methyltransferase